MRTQLRRYAIHALLCLAIGVTAEGLAWGQSTTPPPQSLAIQSMYGPDLFRAYCASCHGRDARGRGPAASSLKTPPSDLTLLAARHGNVFPRGLVASFISTGPMPPAHGSDDMPTWGPIFKSLDPSDTRATIRIANIVSFLESIQQK